MKKNVIPWQRSPTRDQTTKTSPRRGRRHFMRGTCTTVIGAAWGDEGKGKAVDALGIDSTATVRFNGGANAGHTLVVGDQKYVTHLLPCGIVRPNMQNIVGPAVLCDLEVIREEVALARKHFAFVLLDESAPIVLPIHKLIDAGRERAAKAGALGTTKRGIGPASADFWARRSPRLGDLVNKDQIVDRLRAARYYEELLAVSRFLETEAPGLDETIEWLTQFSDVIVPLLGDARARVHQLLAERKNVLFEGAQGVLLDTIQGSSPYTTSSICTAAGVANTLGIYIPHSVIGVSKAYTTRVGAGPFPTELSGDTGNKLRKAGKEYGATTGRPRRCGWLDLMALRYAVRVGGITNLTITKLDILSGMDEVQMCTDYMLRGKSVNRFTTLTTEILDNVEPVYTTFPGWTKNIQGCRRIDDLPSAARDYLATIEAFTEVPISMIGVGPEREQLIKI